MSCYKVDFTKQYNLSYITRYNTMKVLILENPAFKDYNLELMNLGDNLSEECVVIGIFFVDSKNKPSILRNKEEQSSCFLDDSQFYLEDAHGRILLTFSESFNKLKFFSSGMILGFVGYRNEKNIFVCSDVIFPTPLKSNGTTHKKNHKILFMSNISLNDNNFEIARMAIDYFSKTVNDIVIFGDIFTNKKDKFPNLSDFDQFIAEGYPRLHLVPNLNDPSTKMIPIEPFHKMLFNEKAKNLNFLKHPAHCSISESDFILMNSYIIEDLIKYSKNCISYLDIMEDIIKLRYMVPNSPDTIASVPFFEKDPLVINNCNFFVVGGSEKFEFKNSRNVSLITVPDFNKTHSCVVLDLETTQPEEIFFKI